MKSKLFDSDEMRYLELRVQYQHGPVPPHAEFNSTSFWEAFKDWKTYVHGSLLAFGGSIPTYSINYTVRDFVCYQCGSTLIEVYLQLATMVKALGYSSIRAQALTAPPYVFAVFVILGAAWFSDRYQARSKTLLLSYLMGMM